VDSTEMLLDRQLHTHANGHESSYSNRANIEYIPNKLFLCSPVNYSFATQASCVNYSKFVIDSNIRR